MGNRLLVRKDFSVKSFLILETFCLIITRCLAGEIDNVIESYFYDSSISQTTITLLRIINYVELNEILLELDKMK